MKKIVLVFAFLFTISFQINAHWVLNEPYPTVYRLNKIKFFNENIGWIVGEEGQILKTSDGGVSWEIKHTASSVWFNDISFMDENTAMAVGNQNTILKTNNGGISWISKISGLDSTYTFTGISYVKNSEWIAVGVGWFDGLVVIKTINDGETWFKINTGVTWTPLSIRFYDDV